MGAIAPIAAGVLGAASIGASALMMNKMMKSQQNQNSLALQEYKSDDSLLSQIPAVPQAPTGNEADAATNEAEAARKKQLALLEETERQNAVNPTGSLGLTTQANVQRKEALGM